MKKISKTEFISKKPLTGVFIFTCSECPLCDQYIKMLSTKHTGGWYEVVVKSDEKEWVVSDILITGFPTTKVYYDDICIVEKKGILYNKQLNDLYKLIKLYNI